jgi:hypothetical protein
VQPAFKHLPGILLGCPALEMVVTRGSLTHGSWLAEEVLARVAELNRDFDATRLSVRRRPILAGSAHAHRKRLVAGGRTETLDVGAAGQVDGIPDD